MDWIKACADAGVRVIGHEVVPRGDEFSDRLKAAVLRQGPPVSVLKAGAAVLEGEVFNLALPAIKAGEAIEGDVVVVRAPVEGARRGSVRTGVPAPVECPVALRRLAALMPAGELVYVEAGEWSAVLGWKAREEGTEAGAGTKARRHEGTKGKPPEQKV